MRRRRTGTGPASGLRRALLRRVLRDRWLVRRMLKEVDFDGQLKRVAIVRSLGQY